MTYMDKVNYWANHQNLDPELKKELASLSAKELEDAFYTDVRFQTAGMRGLMGVGTNRINIHTIRKATMGFINYLLKKNPQAKVAISYDNRHDSQKFAFDCAALLASHGIKAYIAETLRPTPELSFMTRYYHCDGGIMITASHNPKEYNGYKLYDENGCQLIPELADAVIKEIDCLDDVLAIKPGEYDEKLVEVVGEEVDEAYYEAVLGIRLRKDLPKDFTIAFSPEHGASNIPVRETLKRAGYHVEAVLEQCTPDPDFAHTASPNPEEAKAYIEVLALAKEKDADLLLVCDPDGDRMGVGVKDHNGEYVIFNGNQTGALLLEYILSSKRQLGTMPQNPCIFNTIVTSDIGEAVANYYGVDCEKTLTGFKYIGDKVHRYEQNHEKNYVFGYEESYGSLVSPFVRDKDATQACLMLAEAVAYYRQQGLNLNDVLHDIFDRLGAYFDFQSSIMLPGADGAKHLAEIMSGLRNKPLQEIGGIEVVSIEDYKVQKTYDAEGEKKLSGYDVADVLKYYLADGSFIAVRPSGTEPKCKIYFSIKDLTMDKATSKGEKLKAAMAEIVK